VQKLGQSNASKFIFFNGDSSQAELQAVASSARYADYAEFHMCSPACEEGDLVQISNSSNYDVEKCIKSNRCIGVVSKNPGFKINSQLEDLKPSKIFKVLPIGYLGILKVKVKGSIKKGQYIKVCSIPGVGKRCYLKSNIISLENNPDLQIKLVKCLIQY
jgi:hypothetical protein